MLKFHQMFIGVRNEYEFLLTKYFCQNPDSYIPGTVFEQKLAKGFTLFQLL